MNLKEIKEWRATLQASSHTKERIDALIGMVEELREEAEADRCRLRTPQGCEEQPTCVECRASFIAKYGASE